MARHQNRDRKLFLDFSLLRNAYDRGQLTAVDLATGLFYLDINPPDLVRLHVPLELRGALAQARQEGRLVWKTNGSQQIEDFRELARANGFPDFIGRLYPSAPERGILEARWVDLAEIRRAMAEALRSFWITVHGDAYHFEGLPPQARHT